MLSGSEKEFELLKKETEEIRSYITRYIGYIISLFGASGAITKYLFDKGSSPITIVVLLTLTLILISLIFDIIFYKFKSHNRHVGYTQLLSQEMSYDRLNNAHNKSEPVHVNKTQNPNVVEHLNDEKTNLHSFEFILSRFSNMSSQGGKDAVKKACQKAKFSFMIPKDYSIEYTGMKNEDINADYFNKIIFEIYGHKDKKNQSIRARLQRYFENALKFKKLVRFLFTNIDTSEIISIKESMIIDPKYLSNGWQYQKKVTQVAFIIINIIIVSIFLFTASGFNIASIAEIKESFVKSMLPVSCLIVCLGIYGFWVHRYVLGLVDLMYYKFSIEYYCWSFFLYRVQFLNAFNMVPVYFSRSFIRYFKTAINPAEFIRDIDIILYL